VNEESDIDEVKRLQEELSVKSEKIYLMPQGISTEQFRERQQMIFEACIRNGWNYSPRLHIDVYGNKRGI